jgi:hypothetical protein
MFSFVWFVGRTALVLLAFGVYGEPSHAVEKEREACNEDAMLVFDASTFV